MSREKRDDDALAGVVKGGRRYIAMIVFIVVVMWNPIPMQTGPLSQLSEAVRSLTC